MGIPQKAVAWIAPHEYLALEEKATVKHEYLDGVLYAWQGHASLSMAGGSRVHNEICQNVAFALRGQLKGRPCHVYMTDVRLHVRARDAYFYPDVAVTRSSVDQSTDPSDASVFSEPSLIVEVLSDQFFRSTSCVHWSELQAERARSRYSQEIELPHQLAGEARRAGLHTQEALARLMRDAVRQQVPSELKQAKDRIAAVDDTELTPEEI